MHTIRTSDRNMKQKQQQQLSSRSQPGVEAALPHLPLYAMTAAYLAFMPSPVASGSNSSNSNGTDGSSRTHIECSWLLRLPGDQEEQFYKDASVQRTYALLDAMACIQAVLVNWQLLRKFGWAAHLHLGWSALHLNDHALLPHEQILSVVGFIIAVLQLTAMTVKFSRYLTYRQHVSTFNRLLRLLVILLSLALMTPNQANRQVDVFLRVAVGIDLSNITINSTVNPVHSISSNTIPSPFGACSNHHNCTTVGAGTGDNLGLAFSMQAAGMQGAPPVVLTQAVLAKAFLAAPLLYFNHANFLVRFRYAVVLQVLTCLATVSMDFQKLCVSVAYAQASTAAVVPACESLTALMQAVGHVLDWQFPATSVDLSTSSQAVCQEPLAALLLMKIWAHVIMLVLLPCMLIYSLEYSLKSKFLKSQAAAAEAAAAAAAHGHVSTAPRQALPGQQAWSAPVEGADLVSRPLLTAGGNQQQRDAGPVGAGADCLARMQANSTKQMQQQSAPGAEASRQPSTARQGLQAEQRPLPAGNSSTTARQDLQQLRELRARMLAQTLDDIQPLPVGPMLTPIHGPLWWRSVVLLGFMLAAVLACWYACEMGIIVLLRSGRQLACDVEGWLRFV